MNINFNNFNNPRSSIKPGSAPDPKCGSILFVTSGQPSVLSAAQLCVSPIGSHRQLDPPFRHILVQFLSREGFSLFSFGRMEVARHPS